MDDCTCKAGGFQGHKKPAFCLGLGMNEIEKSLATFRGAFPNGDQIYLNNAGVAPMCRPAIDAAKELAETMGQGIFQISSMLEQYELARGQFARLVGARPDHVSMTQTCAASISLVALGIPLRNGAEIVTWEQEYPSNAYPWFEAARRVNGTVHRVASSGDWNLDTDKLLAAITPKTQVVAVSWVQFQTGSMTDLKRLSAACREQDAWLVVDAIQGLGILPFHLEQMGVDAVCGGTHKWLCGPLGHGFVAFAEGRRDEVQPLMHGAFTYGTPEDVPQPENQPRHDPYRFEPGAPLLFGAIAGAAAIAWLHEAGIERLYLQASRLSQKLAEGILRQGGKVLSALDDLAKSQPRSPITTVVPAGDVERAMQRLREAKIAHAARAGGIRLAPHGFNTDDDIDAVLDALK